MEQTVKKKFGIRDIMTIAAMMVINFAIAMIIGMVTFAFSGSIFVRLCRN